MEIKTENVVNFLKLLSWTKIFQTLVFLIILGIAYAAWENRIVIYNSIKVGAKYESSGPLIIELSSNSKKSIDLAVERSAGLIAGIHVISVDFKKNSRHIVYSSILDENLRRSYEKFVDNKISPTPLFTDSEPNNQRVIDLINGEFVCRPMEETLAGILFRGATSSIKFLCSVSIPPYYGRFSGYMNIYLTRSPTEQDFIVIRQISRDLSLKIYEFDITSTPLYNN